MSNAVCPARRLTEADAAQVCALMQGNPLFYRYHPPQPTPESIRTGMTALPPGKAMEDKGFGLQGSIIFRLGGIAPIQGLCRLFLFIGVFLFCLRVCR